MRHAAYGLRLVVVAAVYYVAARLSLQLALVHGQVAPVWPPTGIALVAIMVFGRRIWPAIAFAALAVNIPLGPSPLGAAAIAAGNTIAPLASAELLRRIGFHPELDRIRDAAAIVGLGALLGMTISATIGSSVLTLSGAVDISHYAATWAVWWAGDAMGVLLVAPFLLSFWPGRDARRLGWAGRIELTAMLAVIALVTFFLFQNQLRLEYLVLPLIAVAAWRFRLRGAAPAALVASLVAGWSAVHGYGPFEGESVLEEMVTLQSFNVSVSLASFLLAAYADGREQRENISRLYHSAQLAMSAKTDAIDVAANELAPPVALLTSYLAILSEGKLGPPPPKWRSILNVMVDKAWQVDRIINELVDAARIEARPAPARGYVDLRDVVKKAVDRARPRADMGGARIALTLPAEPVPVDGDARQIGRILDNLINNSLTYASRPPRLKVATATEGERAVVHVVDNGVGMSKTERDRVFEPFRRTRDPAFSNIPGVGLGLYASRQLAEVNQGRLWLERSEPGVGTCFALDFPLSRSQPAQTPRQSGTIA